MHLTEEDALNLLEGHAQEEQVTEWTLHMEACGGCREHLDYWKEFFLNLNGSHLENAPEPLILNAETIFQPARPRLPRLRDVRQIVASLVFDSLSQPALAGARGTTVARQIVLRAEDFDIHLRISGNPRRMSGQVLVRGKSEFIAGASLYLTRDGEPCGSAVTDSRGEFEFVSIPEGTLNLQMDLQDVTIDSALDVI